MNCDVPFAVHVVRILNSLIPSKNLAKVKHDMIIMDWSTRCIKLHPKIQNT